MHESDARCLRRQVQRPVERRIAASEDHQLAVMEVGRVLDAIVHLGALKLLHSLERQAARLERAHAGCDHHRTGVEDAAGAGPKMEAAIVTVLELEHLFAEVEHGTERLDLLQQAVDQFLRAAHRQRRNVVDRLVRIELSALSARLFQRVDDVGFDPEQAELEYLKQSRGTRADDGHLGIDDLIGHANLPLELVKARDSSDAARKRANKTGFELMCLLYGSRVESCSRLRLARRWRPWACGNTRSRLRVDR